MGYVLIVFGMVALFYGFAMYDLFYGGQDATLTKKKSIPLIVLATGLALIVVGGYIVNKNKTVTISVQCGVVYGYVDHKSRANSYTTMTLIIEDKSYGITIDENMDKPKNGTSVCYRVMGYGRTGLYQAHIIERVK